MRSVFSKSLIALATVGTIASPILAHAESATVTGAGALTTSARLDFRVTIPKVLFLRVGTGNAFGAAANATINLIDFTVPAANVGDASVIAATLASGDQGNGAVTALLRSNGGNVTLTANTLGALTSVALDTIPWSEIGIANSNTVVAPITNTLTHPAALPLTGASANFAPAPTAKVTNVGSTWTFSYRNTTTYAEGVYGPTANGRVTYTASVL